MKIIFSLATLIAIGTFTIKAAAQPAATDSAMHEEGGKSLYIDVHYLAPGKVTVKDVAGAHAKDLATEGNYGVRFIKYWVNEEKGLVYCLSEASDTAAIRSTHAEAHGLLPAYTMKVTDGIAAPELGKRDMFLDIHELGPGKVTAAAVAEAHKKDLAVQGRYKVNFVNYWVDEKAGVVMCLSEAKDAGSVIKTHTDAHGLVPTQVIKVKQGE